MSLNITPDFSRVNQSYKNQHQLFFSYTTDKKIKEYASGKSLTDLIDLADTTMLVVKRGNPIWNVWDGIRSPEQAETATRAWQWQIDQSSAIKKRVFAALRYKQSYYENTIIGKVKKFIMRCFCMWKNGITKSIHSAEKFLFRNDSKLPLYHHEGTYKKAPFRVFPGPDSWYGQNLNMEYFFNYRPNRVIKVEFNGIRPLPKGFVKA